MTNENQQEKWEVAGWINRSKTGKALTFKHIDTPTDKDYYAINLQALINFIEGKFSSCYFTKIPKNPETTEEKPTEQKPLIKITPAKPTQ